MANTVITLGNFHFFIIPIGFEFNSIFTYKFIGLFSMCFFFLNFKKIMDKKNFRVTLVHKERHILVINPNIKSEIKSIIDETIDIGAPYLVKVESLDAIVQYTTQIFEGDVLLIILVEPGPEPRENSNPAQEEVRNPGGSLSEEIEIDLKDIIDKKIKGSDLVENLNIRSLPQGFKLVKSEGTKKLNSKIKMVLVCNHKGCEFKLNFFSNYEEQKSNEIQTDMDFVLGKYVSMHNHKLNYKEKKRFTQEIILEIDALKGKMVSCVELKDYINKKFNTEFEYSQITYQVKQLMEKNFGKADEDAYLLVEKVKEEIKLKGGYCGISLGKENILINFIYVSKTMIEYANKFLDMVLVDSTYKRNRFNIPIVNIIGINNFGHTIMLGFALLSDEKKMSYVWLFRQLKLAWKKEPKFFISDECDSIISGKKEY